MNCKRLFVPTLVAAFGLIGAIASVGIAEPSKDAKSAGPGDFKLPPGWTMEDMQACIIAGTPGKMHQFLAEGAGEWTGKNTMWMTPGADPIKTESTATVSPMMDGRFVKCEMKGEMPGMGPYNGYGLYGFDNVSKKFSSIWIDNHSTGMMVGEGELSSDGKVLTWKYTGNCPITKKAMVMREVETITSPNTRTLEMFGPDPKSGKEFKMMSIELTRKS
jgi:hypothetical protein